MKIGKPKIFGIGFNKTGTTSLEKLLKYYGYKLPIQAEQEILLTKKTFDGDYEPLLAFVPKFDAFQDLPFSQNSTYVVVDQLFPKSKFILTERDADEWFDSLCNYHKAIFDIDDLSALSEQDIKLKFNYLYEGYNHEAISRFLTVRERGQDVVRWDLLYDRSYYIKEYNERNRAIKTYFKDRPENLLIIDITREITTSRICDFLEISRKLITSMPRENVTNYAR